VYKNSPISPKNKWPPTPSKAYICLKVVESDHRCRDEYIGHTLQGDIEDAAGKRTEIPIEQILCPKNCDRLSLILLEGAPGIGKTTLAWELCRKWEEFSCMQQYGLVLLLRLREEEVQRITNTSQLFYSYASEDKEALAKEVTRSQGRGILLILDGFDELPKTLQHNGFLLDLIQGRVLPESTVLVTSRPSATGELLTSCRPRIQKHVEVLGFTQAAVEAYATSVFLSDSGDLEKFKAYISASKNPAINSLMYVPLNAAIIVEVYRGRKSDNLLPHTLTELYTQLCLTIINRYLKVHHPLEKATTIEKVPLGLHQELLSLSKLAYEGFKNEAVVFYTDHPNDIDEVTIHTDPSTLVHFGFLDSVTALYGGGRVSYNFLHLTVQEFFAAYHISHLCSSGLEVFQQYGKEKRWNVVWRFVAGLTKFRWYEDHIDRSLFIYERGHKVHSFIFFFQCLFEAQSTEFISSTFKSSSTTAYNITLSYYHTALAAYSVGYCIANFPIGVSWNVDIRSGFLTFTHGLSTNVPYVGVINGLCINGHQMRDESDTHRGSTIFLIGRHDADIVRLSELIPHLTNLRELSITHTAQRPDTLLTFLQDLHSNNVTSLDIRYTGMMEFFHSPFNFIDALRRLIDPSSGKLEQLGVGDCDFYDLIAEKKLVDLLSAPSSLKSLQLVTDDISSHAVYLKRNTNLVTLELHSGLSCISEHIPALVNIVNCNKTLKSLSIKCFNTMARNKDRTNSLMPLINALDRNKTLQRIEIHTDRGDLSHYMEVHHKQLTLNGRITWI
jgi:hypothetical protein